MGCFCPALNFSNCCIQLVSFLKLQLLGKARMLLDRGVLLSAPSFACDNYTHLPQGPCFGMFMEHLLGGCLVSPYVTREGRISGLQISIGEEQLVPLPAPGFQLSLRHSSRGRGIELHVGGVCEGECLGEAVSISYGQSLSVSTRWSRSRLWVKLGPRNALQCREEGLCLSWLLPEA